MKIILKEDIIGLGYKNDVVDVKNGYGRNFLIPQKKAVIASPSALKQLEETLRQQAHKIEKLKAAAEKRAAQLEGVALEVAAKVSSTGVLYGSVNKNTVSEELAKLGIEVDRKIITMRDIKTVGEYEATIHFFKDVEVKVPVKVVAENAEVLAPAVEEAPVEEAPVDENEALEAEVEEALEAE
jgi:large subunit ribosomal protein L9